MNSERPSRVGSVESWDATRSVPTWNKVPLAMCRVCVAVCGCVPVAVCRSYVCRVCECNTARTAGAGTDDDGNPLSEAAVLHRDEHRLRCASCNTSFCTSCLATPYHLGANCQEHKEYLARARCRYCDDALPRARSARFEQSFLGPWHLCARWCSGHSA